MSKQNVTSGQGNEFVAMANTKGVTRKQLQDNWPTISKALDAIYAGQSITIGVPLVPPYGGRIHIFKIPVDYREDWQTAINAAGPNTPVLCDVCKVADLYPDRNEMKERELVFVNFGLTRTSWDKALLWGKNLGFAKTHPREIFAVGKYLPTLHQELGVNLMYVVATTDCEFGGYRQACNVWWSGLGRGVNLHRVEFFGDVECWFVFVRK